MTPNSDKGQGMLTSALRELPAPDLSAQFYAQLRDHLDDPPAGQASEVRPAPSRPRLRDAAIRRPAALLAITAVVAAASGAALAAALTNALQAPPPPATSTGAISAIAGGGISVQLDPGWTGRAYLGGDKHLPIIQAGNYQLPVGDDDVGSQAQHAIPPGGIFIDVIDFGAALDWMYHATYWSVATLPISIDASDIGAFEDGFAPTYARINRIVNGRALQIDVAFGSSTPSGASIVEANHVLASLSL